MSKDPFIPQPIEGLGKVQRHHKVRNTPLTHFIFFGIAFSLIVLMVVLLGLVSGG